MIGYVIGLLIGITAGIIGTIVYFGDAIWVKRNGRYVYYRAARARESK